MTRTGALTGIRIIESTQFEVGTVCGQQLAWLGAEVIKVEEPTKGEPSRFSKHFFSTLNSSKRGVTLNLKSDEGRKIFLDLVRQADVVIENQGPGTFERLGLSYEVLSSVNPGIIFARAKGFGTYGAYASYKSFDMIAQACSGAMVASAAEGAPPTLERFPVADNATGIHLALGIMAALWQRQTTGRGQIVEATLQDAMFSMGRMWFSRVIEGHDPIAGNRLGPAGDLFPCAPGGNSDFVYIFCFPLRDPMWEALFTAIGREDLRTDPRLSDAAGRIAAAREIDEAVAAWTRERTKFEAMRILGAAGVPCGAVLTGPEALADPHLREREMIIELEHPTQGPITILGSPIKLSDSAPRITPPPLDLGEHNADVYGRLLGLSTEDLRALKAEGVI